MSKRIEWVNRALMFSPYYIGLCKTDDAFKRELKRMKVPREDWPKFVLNEHSDATVHRFQTYDGKLCVIVCIRKARHKTRHAINGLLVHESMHIWRWIRENIGEHEPSSEFEAYSVQNISQSLMEAYWK